MELGSADQAKDLVKFHINYPPTVNGEQIEFSFSNTFNFLQVSSLQIQVDFILANTDPLKHASVSADRGSQDQLRRSTGYSLHEGSTDTRSVPNRYRREKVGPVL